MTDMATLATQNAFTTIGTMRRLLKQIDRAAGTELAEAYTKEATSGDHENLIRATYKLAKEYMPTTIAIEEDEDYYVALATGELDEEEDY